MNSPGRSAQSEYERQRQRRRDRVSKLRLLILIVIAAGLAAYALGPRYARRTPYTVTKGDVQMLSLASILGTAVAFTPIIPD